MDQQYDNYRFVLYSFGISNEREEQVLPSLYTTIPHSNLIKMKIDKIQDCRNSSKS